VSRGGGKELPTGYCRHTSSRDQLGYKIKFVKIVRKISFFGGNHGNGGAQEGSELERKGNRPQKGVVGEKGTDGEIHKWSEKVAGGPWEVFTEKKTYKDRPLVGWFQFGKRLCDSGFGGDETWEKAANGGGPLS